jgi:hypothetical protein
MCRCHNTLDAIRGLFVGIGVNNPGLHEAVTRNHQCKSMQELLDLTFAWLGERNPFKVEGLSVYRAAA